MARLVRNLLKSTTGGMTLEFALVCIPLLLITVGIMEYAFALFQWNTAEKATQFGVRTATVSHPVAEGLDSFNGKSGSNEWGDKPMAPFANTPVVCNGATTQCSNGFTFSASAHNRIVDKMRELYPRIAVNNVVVEYRPVGLGFVGRCGAVPSVTVRLQNMSYDFVLIDSLLSLVGGPGAASLAMPSFASTMVGEDLNSLGAVPACT